MVRISWQQALAWRMQRHLLDPVGSLSPARVAGRLCGVQAQVASSAELAVRVRRTKSRSGEVARALSRGDLVKTWAMRGTLHLLNPEDGGAFLSLIASGRSWERRSWQRYFGVSTKQIEALRRAAREALDGNVLTREELIAAVVAHRGLRHVGDSLRSGWGTLLKPLAWQGDLCFGPSRSNRVTFMLPEDASSRWGGIPDLTTEVDIDGERRYVLTDDLDEIVSTKPTTALRLLPGFDQYVLGPGTADGRVVPPARRAAVSRQAGWISPVVVAGGVVRGTWELERERVEVAWFREMGKPPRSVLEEEVARLSSIVGRPLSSAIAVP